MTELHVDGVLFDSDGVLVDSHERGEVAWQQLAAEYRLDFETFRDAIVGVPAEQTLRSLLPERQVAAATARLEDLEVETATGTVPISGAPSLVAALPAGRFAFATSATLRLAIARWSAAGIDVPSEIITADDVTRGKPDPEPFVRAATLLGLEPDRCVVFEDSDAGGRSAVGAGARVIAVGDRAWSVEPVARIADLRAVRVEPGADGFAMTLVIDGA